MLACQHRRLVMSKASINKLKRIEAFSENYGKLLTLETLAFKKAGSWEKVRSDWWLALIFFFDRAFYQGRSDLL